MKSSSCRSFDVYDFKEEDDSSEIAASRFLGNHKTPGNPNSETPAIMKYELLGCGMSQFVLPLSGCCVTGFWLFICWLNWRAAARGDVVKANEIDNVQWVDVDAIDNDDSCKCDLSSTHSVEGDESSGKQGTGQSDYNSDEGNALSKADNHPNSFSVLQTDDSNDAAASPGDCGLNHVLPESTPSVLI